MRDKSQSLGGVSFFIHFLLFKKERPEGPPPSGRVLFVTFFKMSEKNVPIFRIL